GRDGENRRNIVLTLEALRNVNRCFLNNWNAWVDRAPESWREDKFLTGNSPVAITIRYGQDQRLLNANATAQERQNWENDRDYRYIRQFTFSLATNISYICGQSWRPIPVDTLVRNNGEVYNKPDDDASREEIEDLAIYPLVDDEGYEVPVYNEQGFRVPRRSPSTFITCGGLLNLNTVHELFQAADDSSCPNVPFTLYPMAFTKSLGNIQAKDIMPVYQPRIDLINDRHRPAIHEVDSDYDDDDTPTRRGAPVLRGTHCQVYNSLSHRVRDAAKFHDVQLGMVTAAFSGTTAKSAGGHNLWTRRMDQCNNALPHIRFAQKVAGPSQPESMRFENTYTLDVYRLEEVCRNGSTIYDEIITPLLKGWSHHSILSVVKDTIIPFHPGTIPLLFSWTSYPITSLIERLWSQHKETLKEGAVIDPSLIEVISMLERTLNFSHTGNAQVMSRHLMDRAWLSLGIINDGLPCLSDAFVVHASLLANSPVILRTHGWPVSVATRRPLTSSRRGQEMSYGNDHYQAYEARFTIHHAIDNIPAGVYANIECPTMQLSCYAAEIGLRVYFNDAKHLIHRKVMEEIQVDLESNDLQMRRKAEERQTALSKWLGEDLPFSYSGDVFPCLLQAVVHPEAEKIELTESHLGRQPISFFVGAIVKQCTQPQNKRCPPFIKGGNFLPVMRVGIDEIKRAAIRSGVKEDGLISYITEAISHVCDALKINHVPWSPIPTGRPGNSSKEITHNVWLNLGGIPAPKTQPFTSFLTRQQSSKLLAVRASENIRADDPRGEWFALDVRLNSFASVLHKIVLPNECAVENASVSTGPKYISDTYHFVHNTFAASKPLHQLAVFVATAFAGLVPKVFTRRAAGEGPNDPAALAACIRGLEWEAREKRGVTEQEPFIVLMTTYIIALYEPTSPLSVLMKDNASTDKWVKKHWPFASALKGITPLTMCRLGLGKAVKPRALGSARWGQDVIPLSQSEIQERHAEVVRLLRAGGVHGGFDAVVYLMGTHTAQVLASTHFVKPRHLPSLQASSSKRTVSDWDKDDDGRVTTGTDVVGLRQSSKRLRK
ncbi:hypothetical protein BDN67DRAFT_985937, partial [Paxillus ammoniavirescens]